MSESPGTLTRRVDGKMIFSSSRRVLSGRHGVVMVLVLLCVCLIMPGSGIGAILEVRAGSDLSSISAAVARAVAGDTIHVSEGIYREHHIVVEKSIVIIGNNLPVVDAEGNGGIFEIWADNVTIQGLELRGVPTSFIAEHAAILIENAEHVTIRGNRIRDCFFAIYAANSQQCLVLDNDILGSEGRLTFSGNGIHLWYSKEIAVVGNRILGHRDGIYMEFVTNSRVDSNICRNNLRYGLHFMFSDSCKYENNLFSHNTAGVAVMYTHNVLMYHNTFEQSWGGASYGLLLKDIKYSRVEDNLFRNNSVGLHMEGSDHILISGNSFSDNGWAIKIMSDCTENLIASNDFINNSFAVATNGRQNHSRFQGNYWSTYQGFDLDRDGFGDLPYRPVSLFSLMVESNPPTLVLLHSLLADVLDLAERVIPSLTPETLVDGQPRMRPNL